MIDSMEPVTLSAKVSNRVFRDWLNDTESLNSTERWLINCRIVRLQSLTDLVKWAGLPSDRSGRRGAGKGIARKFFKWIESQGGDVREVKGKHVLVFDDPMHGMFFLLSKV